MGVPTLGNFSMFGSGDNTTIAGAIVEGGANAGTVAAATDFNTLKGLADITKFDANFSEGASTLTQITKTIQFRGYPATITAIPCYVYEYINTTSTTFSFGPYPLCPGPGVFDIQIGPGAEGVTFCIEELSQGTIDAFNAQGLILTPGASTCDTASPRPTTLVNCGTTYTSGLFEQSFSNYFRIPLGTITGTSFYILDVAAAVGAGSTGAIRFVITYNDLTVQDTGWVSRDSSANSVYLNGLNNLLTSLGYPTVASITVISSPITGSFNKNLSLIQDAFVEVFIYRPRGSTGNPFTFEIDCLPS